MPHYAFSGFTPFVSGWLKVTNLDSGDALSHKGMLWLRLKLPCILSSRLWSSWN